VPLEGVGVSRSEYRPIKGASKYKALETSVGGLSEVVNQRSDYTHIYQNFHLTSGSFLGSWSDNF
jgi:hypothetical protein